MEAYLGAPESYDSIEIDGSPRLDVKVAGGIHGYVATISMVINSISKVLGAAPGLHTMRDMPLPSFFPGDRPPCPRVGGRVTVQILARCPKCDAALPVAGDEQAQAITCGGCGRDIPLCIEATRCGRIAASTAVPSAAAPTSTRARTSIRRWD